MGLTLQDLKILTYVDVLKIFLSFSDKSKNDDNDVKTATQNDIDKLLR